MSNADIHNPNYLSKTFLGKWSNEQVIHELKPEKRSSFLGHLCEMYWPKYRIVPVREHRRNEGNDTLTIEDAFLFPIHGRNYIYILWESTVEKRATYVFRCTPSHYDVAVQKVFDYVISDGITNKRDRLRKGDVGFFKNSIVEYRCSLNHNNIEDWKRHLSEVCWY